MKLEDLYALGARPINKAAGNSTKPGEEWVPRLRFATPADELVFDFPPVTQPLPEVSGARPKDWTGAVFNRLTVVGYVGRHETHQRHYWSCRCQCGRYVIRKNTTLAAGKNVEDMCRICNYLEHLKHQRSKP